MINKNINIEKEKIRNTFLLKRNKITNSNLISFSNCIFKKIRNLNIYKKSNIIMLYLSLGTEVITDFMIKSIIDDGKLVVMPIITDCINKKMSIVKILNLFEMRQRFYCCSKEYKIDKNEYDIITNKKEIDLIFVPGIAFDVFGYRIGYGKGYYDRWLFDVPKYKIVGIAYDIQVVKKIPINKYDLPVGFIITDKRIIKT
jgi:5-formyltetrahydrofolate cyclo-ligase